ncbi:MAG: UDP-N-acetylmuramate dehydrogenase [Acutalibacter sp.]|nr:UDP-N-acetylmuramate dehydrogenase [Acutalibacter sp.]
MSKHTTFRIGGPADRFLTVESKEQLAGFLSVLESAKIPWQVLGNGSNLLVSDKGIRGAVLTLGGNFAEIELLPDGKTVRAGAAVMLSSLCAFARDKGLSGLEFAWGIPGSVGGAAYMNAGAYGGEMKDVIQSVTHLTPEGEIVTLPAAELELSYRHSRYTGRQDIILWVEYGLRPGEVSEIAGKMNEQMERRKAKQPYDMPSAGSIFKRPVNGFAAAIIEECGLKGKQIGGAQVSPKHAGFIVNTGEATCEDVLELIKEIRKTVKEQTGTELECEVCVIGER